MSDYLNEALTILKEKAMTWFEQGVAILPNFVVAVFVVVLFYLLAKLASRVVANLIGKTSANPTVINLTRTTVYLLVLFSGLFVALGILHLDKTVTSLLAGAGVIGLALGFAFQEMASNFISGIFIAFQKPYRVGDIIRVHSNNEYFGTVQKINLRTTNIMTFDGLEVFIPNKDLFTQALVNYTTTPDRRVDIEVGVSYGDALPEAAKQAKQAVSNMDMVLKDKEVEVFFNGFGDSSINFDLRFWVKYSSHKEYLRARHEAVMAVKQAFDEHGINIPFPLRTLDISEQTVEKVATVWAKHTKSTQEKS
jgi:small conductance mechanosensitive channel